MTRDISRLSGWRYLARLLRTGAAKRLSRRRRRASPFKVACFPGDDIGDNVIAHGIYEDLLLEGLFDVLLADKKSEFLACIAADIGANIGNHSLWFSQRFAQVAAFEPNPICVKLFEANVLMNGVSNVRLWPVGLSDKPGMLEFYLDRSGNLGRSGVTSALSSSTDCSFPVQVAQGDFLLDDETLGGLRIALLKIDVEGHEHSALAGLGNTLLTHKPIILFESHGARGENGSDLVVNLLMNYGYENYYVIERRTSPFKLRPLKAIYRALFGQALSARKVGRPEDRGYSLIVATVSPLSALG